MHPGPISHGWFFAGDIWPENTFRGGWRAWGARHRVCRAPRRGWVPPTPEKIRNPVAARAEWSNFAQNRFGRFARIPGFPHPEVAGAPGDPGTGSAGLYVGVWGPRPGKKYEIRYPAVRGASSQVAWTILVIIIVSRCIIFRCLNIIIVVLFYVGFLYYR